jgi:hypothetical protein
MGVMYWARVVVMVFAFVGVMTVMRQLNTAAKRGSGAPLIEILTGPRAEIENGLDLCPTRILEMHMIGGPLFFQRNLKWFMRLGALEQELDQIAMEKWFSTNCHIEITPTPSVSGAEPILKITFVSGEPASLMSSPDGFVWMGRKFKSEQLQRALQELTSNIPARQSAK